MHPWVMDFARRHSKAICGKTIEVGSYNVNGSVKEVLPITLGVDMREGPGVDEVCAATDLINRFGAESWDSVVSVEMLEHAEDWRGAVANMWGILKPGGSLLLTTRSPGFPLHDYPGDFWRFTTSDFKKMFPGGIVEADTEAPGVGVVVVKGKEDPNVMAIEPGGPE